MIKNYQKLKNFEEEILQSKNINLFENLKTIKAMLQLAQLFNVWPSEDILEDIEVDIKVARVVNNVGGTTQKTCQRFK